MPMRVSTEQARTKRCPRRCPRPFFLKQYPYKMALVKCPCAFRLSRLAQNAVPGGVPVHFSEKNLYKMALVKCPCAFRLSRLAQNAVPGGVPVHFSWKKSIQNGSCEMSICVSTAQARTKRCPRRCPCPFFLEKIHTKWLLWNVHLRFDCAGSHKTLSPEVSPSIFPKKNPYKMALVKCPSAFRLRRLAQNAVRGGVPVHFSWKKSIQNGSCEMSICVSTAQARTKRCPRRCPRPFFLKQYPYKMALVKCPCAFRLSRLAQNAVPGGVPVHFSCQFLHKMVRTLATKCASRS